MTCVKLQTTLEMVCSRCRYDGPILSVVYVYVYLCVKKKGDVWCKIGRESERERERIDVIL